MEELIRLAQLRDEAEEVLRQSQREDAIIAENMKSYWAHLAEGKGD